MAPSPRTSLVELYEMVALNDTVLTAAEKRLILKADLAMRLFERAMQALAEGPK